METRHETEMSGGRVKKTRVNIIEVISRPRHRRRRRVRSYGGWLKYLRIIELK